MVSTDGLFVTVLGRELEPVCLHAASSSTVEACASRKARLAELPRRDRGRMDAKSIEPSERKKEQG